MGNCNQITINVLRFLFACAIIFTNVTGSAEGYAVENEVDPGAKCTSSVTENIYLASVDGDGVLVPIDPVELDFGYGLATALAIQGKVASDSEIVIKLYRFNQLEWTSVTRSDENGFYRISPYGKDCSTGKYRSVPDASQVSVTVGEQTYTTVAQQNITTVDPITNSVYGEARSGKQLSISLLDPSSAVCDDTNPRLISGVATAGTDRKYRAVLEDFSARAVATLRIQDGQGSSFIMREARQISLSLNTGGFSGLIDVNGLVTYTLARAGAVIETAQKMTTNYISHKFTETLLPGDLIEARSVDRLLYSTVVADLSGSLDVEADVIVGTSQPNWPIHIASKILDGGGVGYTHCSIEDLAALCGVTGEDGAFELMFPFDLRHGDTTNLIVYDEQGNKQNKTLNTGPVIFWDKLQISLYASFPDSPGQSAEARILDQQNNVLWQEESDYPTYEPGRHQWSLPYDLDILPGYTITVVSNGLEKSMVVPDIVVDPLYGKQEFSGYAPDGVIIVGYSDNDLTGTLYECAEVPVSGGRFSVSMGDEPFTGNDDFLFVYSDGQGGYTNHYHRSRYLSLRKDQPGASFEGSVEQPGPVTITHLREGDIIETYQSVANFFGGFGGAQSLNSSFQQGDQVVVEAEDGTTFTMRIPELSAELDLNSGQVVGRAIEIKGVFVTVERTDGTGYRVKEQFQVFPDSTGSYRADLPVLIDQQNCRALPVNRCIAYSLTSYTPDGNLISWTGPQPGNVTADIYEPDNSRSTASLYAGPQQHTILAVNEEDWVRIEISPQQVGKSVTFSVSDLGYSMSMRYAFFSAINESNGAYGTFRENGKLQDSFTPAKAGTYYLKLTTDYTSYKYGSCDSTYTLKINVPLPLKLYLPVMAN